MGGFGSGRYQRGNSITSDYLQLDVRRLQRDGHLQPGRSFYWQWIYSNGTKVSIKIEVEEKIITLIYRNKFDPNQKEEYCTVLLDRTSCNFGGERIWFICPGITCWRRVAILYYGQTGFVCRHCLQLAYSSQREDEIDRSSRQINKIRRRLGWQEGLFNLPSGKPKGMHWKTFEKLSHQHNVLCKISLDRMKKELDLPN